MKKAIGYVRISTEDQSNFSIDGQQKLIKDYCSKKDIHLIEVFVDEGQSAKNFDRYSWKTLESFLKLNYKHIDTLIVAKYDRFSRNLREALNTIENLEKKYSIVILSVNENIGLHPQSPYFFQMRTQILLGAEVEWRMIRDRTKFGINTAQKAGRWLNMAPFGYVNSRDNQNKPIIVIDNHKSLAIKYIFKQYIIGSSIEQIRKSLKEKGFIIKGKSAIQSILSNPVYCGKIKVSAYYDEPEHLVNGIHEPIISEEDFYKAMAISKSKKGQLHQVIRDEVPLRGVLHCHCNKLLTAGNSKSRNGNYYWYYKCNTHVMPNYNASILHSKFDEILSHLNFSKNQIDLITKQATDKLKDKLNHQTFELESAKKELKEVLLKINGLEEKYIFNKIEQDVYDNWKPKLKQQEIELLHKIESFSIPLNKVIEKFNYELLQLNDIAYLYNSSTTVQKQSFVNLVFYNSLSYIDDSYRTKDMLSIFYDKALILKSKKLLIVEKLFKQNLNFATSAPQSTSIEPVTSIQPLINWINSLKIAS